MAQAMQRTERFGQPGLLFHTPEHIRNIAPRLVVISTGKNVGTFGLRQGGQNGASLVIHGDGFRFAFLGDRTAQCDESPFKIKVFPLKVKKGAAAHPGEQSQTHKGSQRLIRLVVLRLQQILDLFRGKILRDLVVHCGHGLSLIHI